jgi:hypothetical protein
MRGQGCPASTGAAVASATPCGVLQAANRESVGKAPRRWVGQDARELSSLVRLDLMRIWLRSRLLRLSVGAVPIAVPIAVPFPLRACHMASDDSRS